MVVVGGDYRDPKRSGENAAYSSDGGMRWNRPAGPPGGFRSAVRLMGNPMEYEIRIRTDAESRAETESVAW